jgi:hypothetical protein
MSGIPACGRAGLIGGQQAELVGVGGATVGVVDDEEQPG